MIGTWEVTERKINGESREQNDEERRRRKISGNG